MRSDVTALGQLSAARAALGGERRVIQTHEPDERVGDLLGRLWLGTGALHPRIQLV